MLNSAHSPWLGWMEHLPDLNEVTGSGLWPVGKRDAAIPTSSQPNQFGLERDIMRLKTLSESVADLNEATQQQIIREAPHFPLPADVPSELYPLSLGNYVDMGMEDYPPEYATAAGLSRTNQKGGELDLLQRWSLALATTGVRVPGTPYTIHSMLMGMVDIRRTPSTQPIPALPPDWRGYIQVADSTTGIILWYGNKLRKGRQKVDVAEYADDGEGRKLKTLGYPNR